MNMIIRPMEKSERQETLNVARKAFNPVLALFVSKPKQAYVAIVDDKIVGGIQYKYITSGEKKVGYIDTAFVHPDYQGKGVGSKLYGKTCEYLLADGCEALTALVQDDNVASWGVFVKHGFSRVSALDIMDHLGFKGWINQYCRTPWCVATGMEYYLRLKDSDLTPRKRSMPLEMIFYLILNIILMSPFFIYDFSRTVPLMSALAILLAGNVVSSYIGTRFSPSRAWKFRVSDGGGVMSILLACIRGIYLLCGNWFPREYENTPKFRRDMGIVGLWGWLYTLSIVTVFTFMEQTSMLNECILFVGQTLLIYRVLAFSPLSAFGGGRVYQWNKVIFGILALASLGIVYLV